MLANAAPSPRLAASFISIDVAYWPLADITFDAIIAPAYRRLVLDGNDSLGSECGD